MLNGALFQSTFLSFSSRLELSILHEKRFSWNVIITGNLIAFHLSITVHIIQQLHLHSAGWFDWYVESDLSMNKNFLFFFFSGTFYYILFKFTRRKIWSCESYIPFDSCFVAKLPTRFIRCQRVDSWILLITRNVRQL